MSVVNTSEVIYANTVRGRFGRPTGFGGAMFGWTWYGMYNDFSGVYQRRHHYRSLITHSYNKHKAKITVRMHHAWPDNPRTEPQQNWRAVFSGAVQFWQSLTTEQKNVYNKRAKGRYQNGYALCLREYLLAH